MKQLFKPEDIERKGHTDFKDSERKFGIRGRSCNRPEDVRAKR